MTAERATILLVEDEAIVQMLVVDFLSDLGYDIIEASDAKTALPIIESQQRIDLLVTDVGLPGMNGRELAIEARRHRPDLKVLFATGYADGGATKSEPLGGIYGVVAKPFDLDQFAAKIHTMITGA